MPDTNHRDTKTPPRQTKAPAPISEAVHGTGDFARHSAAAATAHGARTLAETHREFLEGAADRFEDVGRKILQSMQQAGDVWWSLMARSSTTATSRAATRQDLHQDVAGLIDGVARTNIEATQDLFRLADPAALIDLQQRFARDWIDAWAQGRALMLRAMRAAAGDTLRPLAAASPQDGKVGDVMSTQVRLIGPDDTVQQAACLMREQNVGALPVGDGDKLVGMVTDRDVTLRLVADGRDPARTKVRDVMTADIRYVFEDEALGHAAENMAEQKVRRLPVVNRAKRLVGVLSLGDLAVNGNQRWLAGRALDHEPQPAKTAAE